MVEKFKDELEEIYTNGFKSEVNRIREEIKKLKQEMQLRHKHI